MSKVLLVDDDLFYSKGVHDLLETRNYKVSMVHDIEAAWEKFCIEQFDVILMDIVLPKFSGHTAEYHKSEGIELVKQIKTRSPTQPVVISSAHADRFTALLPLIVSNYRSLVYLLKGCSLQELLHGIETAQKGHVYLDRKISDHRYIFTALSSHLLDEEKHWVNLAITYMPELTEREMRIVQLVASAQNNKSVSQKLNLSLKTVEGHITEIYSKLHLDEVKQQSPHLVEKIILVKALMLYELQLEV